MAHSLIEMHTKSQPCTAGKFFAVLILFLSHRTEVPQCSGQACFDRERGRREEIEKKRLVRKEGRLGFKGDLKWYKGERERKRE